MHYARLVRIVAIAAAFIALCGIVHAQTAVTVQLFQPPPNQLKIADFWRIRLTNNSNTTYTVCLFGTLDETNLGKHLVEATTARFTLPPGTKLITGAEIQPIDAQYFDNKYKDVFLRTGQAPAGEYRICVQVRLDCGDQVLATDCKTQVVQPVTPPILISPPIESTVEEPLPAFSWLPPSPLNPRQQVRYTLKIVEVLGRQTPYDAMQSNPAWFERANIVPTVMQYPISSRKFIAKSRYAWRVTASDGGFPLGESEIWWFTYLPRTVIGGFNNDGGVDSAGGRRRFTTTPGTGITTLPGGVKTVFTDTTGRGRGVAILNLTDVGPIARLSPTLIDIAIGKLTVTVPPALLKELLRSCQGD